MAINPAIDTSKSLAQLTGVDWGPAPADARELVRERHEVRRTPIRELPDTTIVRFLQMGSDADILVQVALERLNKNPDAVDLLCAILGTEHLDWRNQPELVMKVRHRVYAVTSEISQITSDLERLHNEAVVWRHYAEFECRLSAI